jgi:hypothetical protein
MATSRKTETELKIVVGSTMPADQPIETGSAPQAKSRNGADDATAAQTETSTEAAKTEMEATKTETSTEALKAGISSTEAATIDFDDYAYVLADDGPGELVEVSTRLMKKPGEEYFFVDPRPEMRKRMALCEVKAGYSTEFYGVRRHVQEELGRRKVHLYEIRVCYGRDTGLFLWALRVANPIFVSEWHRTQWKIADEAQQAWLAMEPNEARTAYAMRTSRANPPWKPPTLTKRPIDELIADALGDRWIDDINHVLLKQRRGEI